MSFRADRVVRKTYRLPSPLFSVVVLSVIKITHWGWGWWGGTNIAQQQLISGVWLLSVHLWRWPRLTYITQFLNVKDIIDPLLVMPAWKPARKGRNISGWWNKVAENPTKIETPSREKCRNWFRLIISLNYRCLSACVPSLLQSRLGCLTRVDRRTQICSVRRSACVLAEENEACFRFEFFKVRPVWNLPFLSLLLYSSRLLNRWGVRCGRGSSSAWRRPRFVSLPPEVTSKHATSDSKAGCCRLFRYRRLLIDRSFSCQHLWVHENTWARPYPRLRVSNKKTPCACVHAWMLC